MSNPELALSLVKLHLVELNDFMNLTRPMTMAQITQTAELILDEFPTLKIADIIYTFKRVKKGEYGELYNGIDGTKICMWLQDTFNEKCNAGENATLREHEATKASIYKERNVLRK